MPYGVIPDSWGLWAIRKALRAMRGGGREPSFGGRSRGRMGYHYKFSHLNLYQEELRRYLNTPSGDLWAHLEKRSKIALAGAKLMVGSETGSLRDSIHYRHLGSAYGQYIWLGSKHPLAYLHHEGTRPHTIVSEKPNKPLVFRAKSQVIVHTTVVNHPGTRPNPYLRAQLIHFVR